MSRQGELAAKVEAMLGKRDERREEFQTWLGENESRVPSKEEQERIARLCATELVEEIRNGSVSAEAAMITQCLRALASARTLNCTADEMFLEAVKAAQAADKHREEAGPDALPLLHGLPISVKDHIDVKGTVSTCGIMSRCSVSKEKNAAIVDSLIQHGAIPFVKGNVPQLLMVPETMNRVFGRSSNPWSPARSPGGSSGGEGALVGSFAAHVGIGTDIGGSIRIPAHFCGVAGFKPTPERVSTVGVSAPPKDERSGQVVVRSVAGPLARRVRDLELIVKCLLAPDSAMYERDAFLARVPFSAFARSPCRLGYFFEDGWFEVAPANRRAVEEAKQALEAAGYELVPFTVPEPLKFVHLYIGALASDGGMKNLTSGLAGGEPVLDEYLSLSRISKLGSVSRRVAAGALEFGGEKRKAHVLRSGGQKSVFEYWQLVAELNAYRQLFVQHMQDAGVQGLLCPGGTLPALPHGASKELALAQSLTFLFNLLHFPAGSVPVTLTRADECVIPDPRGDSWSRDAQASMEGAEGLPVGVQIATLPWKDEQCLSIMEDVEAGVGFHDKFADQLPFVNDEPKPAA